MARVSIDTCVFGDEWFRNILSDLTQLPGVEFVRSFDSISAGEHERAKKLGQLLTLLAKKGKVVVVEKEDAEKHIDYLHSLPEWQNEAACDDAHIFAATHERNVKYVFTAETRLATCRDCINKVVSNRYCSFSLIRSEEVYKDHRPHLGK